jgi:transcriptional regulator with XRE-family HTH domain
LSAEGRPCPHICSPARAELLDVSQPIVSAYERGLLRLHGELIVKLREILDCSADELLGLQERKATNSGSNLRMARRLQQIKLLPKSDQEALRRVIDALCAFGKPV